MTEPEQNKPTICIKPHSYQPIKSEVNEDVQIDCTPEELASSVLQQVNVVKNQDS